MTTRSGRTGTPTPERWPAGASWEVIETHGRYLVHDPGGVLAGVVVHSLSGSWSAVLVGPRGGYLRGDRGDFTTQKGAVAAVRSWWLARARGRS